MRGRVFLCALLITMAGGCQDGGEHATLVLAAGGSLNRQDAQDAAAATSAVNSYIRAWLEKDYAAMWSLHCKRGIGNYALFLSLNRTWRTKGFKHASLLVPENRSEILGSLRLVQGVSDEQARVLLTVLVTDSRALRELQTGDWPQRAAVLRMTVAGDESYLIAVKEGAAWSVLSQPGTLGPECVPRPR